MAHGHMADAELVRIFGDKQKYPRRGRPVLVLYDSDTAALKLILVGEMHPKELPDANSVVAMPTACASMVGTDLLASKDCRTAGFSVPGIRLDCTNPGAHLYSEIDRQGARLQPHPREPRKIRGGNEHGFRHRSQRC